MPSPQNERQERNLQRLIESLIDGTIDERQFNELVAKLQQDPDALATYADYINLHSALRQNYLSHPQGISEHLNSEQLDGQLNQVLNSDSSKGSALSKTRRFIPLYAALAAAILVSALVIFQRSPSTDKRDPSLAASNAGSEASSQQVFPIEGVAVLTRLVDVVWESGSPDVEINTPLARQELRIKSGLMQIEFYCGAAVIVEGPAAIDLLSADRAFAHHGKLRAHVPARAKGFTIGTKSGDVVDLGTEFGLDISTDGPSELHVIDGEVDFHDTVQKSNAPQRLVGGQAIEVARDGQPHRLMETDASRFVNHQELLALASAKHDGRRREWIEYHHKLRIDPTLVADYVFSDGEGWGRTLVNSAPTSSESSFGAIVGASWMRGRWPESKALQFNSPSDRVRIKLDGEFDALTLACWVNIQEFADNRPIALLHPEIDSQRSDDDKQRFIHWTLNPTPMGAVLHFAESHGHGTEARNHYSSVVHGLRTEDLGSWVHLAVVYDPESRLVSHYKDGMLVGDREIESPRKLGIGIADICNWPYKEWAANTQFEFRNLNGILDEFVVLGRALSPGEIYEMYDVGSPY